MLHLSHRVATALGVVLSLQAELASAETAPSSAPSLVAESPAPPGGVAPPENPFRPAPRSYEGADAVTVHITPESARSHAELRRETSNGWETVCTVPCSTTLDPKISYIVGNNATPFYLPKGVTALDLVETNHAHRGLRTAGAVTLGVGLLAAAASPLLFINVNSTPAPSLMNPNPVRPSVSDSQKDIGYALIATGAALAVTGIVLMAMGPSETVLTTTSGESLAMVPSISLGRGLALSPSGITF